MDRRDGRRDPPAHRHAPAEAPPFSVAAACGRSAVAPFERHCGCHRLAALSTSSKDEKVRERESAAAEKIRDAWRCGRSKASPLAPREQSLARAFERLLGADEGACDGCPFEGVYHPDDGGWLSELLDARVLVTDEHLPWPDALGRPLAAVDAQALAAFVRARARMNRLDHQKDKL